MQVLETIASWLTLSIAIRPLLGFAALASMTLPLTACVSDTPHRIPGYNVPNASFQDISYRTKDPVPADVKFSIGYVEFDDQGWFQDIRQRDVLFDNLSRLTSHKEKLLIVVFTHGWKHNAAEDDPNVRQFKKLLADLSLVENGIKSSGKARTVVGVYLGWRGASVPIPLVEDLTFWARKNAAERVGERSAKQIMMELDQFRAVNNQWKTADRLASAEDTQLIFIGHSFGGLITFDALRTEWMDRALRVDIEGNYTVAKSFGDFALLVNPAFEGSSYESLWRAAQTRNCFPEEQRPILTMVTSQTDWATGIAFPAGRLYTLLQSAPHPGEREAVMMTAGHMEAYRTHVLTANEVTPEPPDPQDAGDQIQTRARAERVLQSLPRRAVENLDAKTPENYDGGTLTLFPNPQVPARFPYLVVSATKEMIDGHDDIWNPRFRDFMLHFVATQIMRPAPAKSETQCKAFGTTN